MSDDRPGRGPRSTEIAELRGRVGEQLANAHKLIRALERDLASQRADYQQLAAECERLRTSLAAAGVVQLQCAQYEAQLRKSRDRERELRDAMAALDRDHTKLLSYAAGIEAALDEEREHRELAGLEMACLQEQVDLLQATVDQLVATGASPPDP